MFIRRKQDTFQAWNWSEFLTEISVKDNGRLELPNYTEFYGFPIERTPLKSGYFIYAKYGRPVMSEDTIAIRYEDDLIVMSKEDFNNYWEIVTPRVS